MHRKPIADALDLGLAWHRAVLAFSTPKECIVRIIIEIVVT